MITTFTSREFNQDVTKAKREALQGPVIITDRGKPAHVLLNIEEYRRLSNQNRNIAEALALYDSTEIEFEPELIEINFKPADLS